MTSLALSQLVQEAPAFLQRISQSVSRFFAGLDEARLFAARFKALSALSDAQLAELGLRREDIPKAVLDLRVRI